MDEINRDHGENEARVDNKWIDSKKERDEPGETQREREMDLQERKHKTRKAKETWRVVGERGA